jgi:predicted outer membrane repeat protein
LTQRIPRDRRRLPLSAALAAVAALAALGNLVMWRTAYADTAVTCHPKALIKAIVAANAAGAPVTLSLPSGCVITYEKAFTNQNNGGDALPRIVGNITILGNGATLKRDPSAPTFRFFEVKAGGTLTLSSLSLVNGLLPTQNTNGGAGVDNWGTLTVVNCAFSNGSSPSSKHGYGGAIQNGGQLSVTGTTFSGNSALLEGGAIFNQGTASIGASTFTNNRAGVYGGGALVNVRGTTTVVSSAFVGNTAPGGGAIDNDTALSVTDSTFYDNEAGDNGGGAIGNFGTATITQSTLSANDSRWGANVHTYCVSGVACSTTLRMSIVANAQEGDDCSGNPSPPVIDAGYNLEDSGACAFEGGDGSMNDTAPSLGALQDNGGSTETMAPAAGSPAIDAIPPSASGCASTFDQRGISRPQGAGCDIGAVEVVPPAGGSGGNLRQL